MTTNFLNLQKCKNKTSDIVGNFNFTPNDIFKIDYNFSADNNLQTMNFLKLKQN